jgi:hypothetical protein
LPIHSRESHSKHVPWGVAGTMVFTMQKVSPVAGVSLPNWKQNDRIRSYRSMTLHPVFEILSSSMATWTQTKIL